eukprot:TRINITY_DN2023_c0_g2_i1.p1 TRINITY_DN2023_c0_g2~~TRINITY_DN2023_c0_g2_i1.p1  ORF type:complete len:285 (-),score=82.25 TRINITY_DN2023_c0_g2_i1:443-1171(-)
MDTFGLSDPYVIVKLGDQEEKTPVVDKNLNPRWAYDFSFGVANSDQIVLFSVYDYDAGPGSHDFMGQVSVPVKDLLNGTASSSWYDLEDLNGGKSQGRINLQFEYIPKGEEGASAQPEGTGRKVVEAIKEINTVKNYYTGTINQLKKDVNDMFTGIRSIFETDYYEFCRPDDIGKLNICVLEGKELPKMDLIGSSDPYVVLELGKQTEKTAVVKNSLEPKMDSGFHFWCFKCRGIPRFDCLR